MAQYLAIFHVHRRLIVGETLWQQELQSSERLLVSPPDELPQQIEAQKKAVHTDLRQFNADDLFARGSGETQITDTTHQGLRLDHGPVYG